MLTPGRDGDYTSGLVYGRSLLMATLIHHYKDTKKKFVPGECGAIIHPGTGTQTSTSGRLSMGWRFLYWRKSVGIPGKKPLFIFIIPGEWTNMLSLMSQLSERLLYGLSIFIIKNPREVFLPRDDFNSYLCRAQLLRALRKG